MLTDMKLTEMLCTRLCHDITGPVGAIANGAEFLAEEDSSMQDQAVELITQSAQEAVNRLQFYRMAYGRVSQRGEACIADCKELIRKFFDNGKIRLDWPEQPGEEHIPLSRNMARLMFNLVIIAAGTLIRGGVISIRLQQHEERPRMLISASGMSLKWDEKVEKALKHEIGITELEPSTAQAYFTRVVADEAHAELQMHQGTEMFEICVTQNESALVN